jgi:hypothetical protein
MFCVQKVKIYFTNFKIYLNAVKMSGNWPFNNMIKNNVLSFLVGKRPCSGFNSRHILQHIYVKFYSKVIVKLSPLYVQYSWT